MLQSEQAESAAPEIIKPAPNEDIVAEIEKSVSFKYGEIDYCNEPAKRNASALDAAEDASPDLPIILGKPAFMSTSGAAGHGYACVYAIL